MVEQSGGPSPSGGASPSGGGSGVPPPRRVRPPGSPASSASDGSSAAGADPTAGATGRRTLWQRIAGDGTHLGFWTLPVFVATALGGAVIAGGLAQVYYGQQVAQLEEETAAARNSAERAAQDID